MIGRVGRVARFYRPSRSSAHWPASVCKFGTPGHETPPANLVRLLGGRSPADRKAQDEESFGRYADAGIWFETPRPLRSLRWLHRLAHAAPRPKLPRKSPAAESHLAQS